MANDVSTPEGRMRQLVQWQLEREVEYTREAIIKRARSLADRLTWVADGPDDHILGATGVVGAHDLHVWSLTSGVDVMSAHVVIREDIRDASVLDELRSCLAEHFDIEHSTFQIEHSDRLESEHAAH